MPKLTRTNVTYPARGQNPWFNIQENMLQDFDAIMYAHREDRNLVLMGGGTITWTVSSSELAFTADIVILSPQKAFHMTLPSTESPITIAEGSALYVQVTRAPGATVTLSPFTSATIPNDNNSLLLAFRESDVLYFRNGRGFTDGDSGKLYAAVGVGAIAGFTRRQVTIQTNGDTWIGDNGATDSAATQGALGAGFSNAVLAPGSVDVYFNNALCHYTTGAPASVNEWRWVITSSPTPVIEIGAGSLANDIVTVKYPI